MTGLPIKAPLSSARLQEASEGNSTPMKPCIRNTEKHTNITDIAFAEDGGCSKVQLEDVVRW